MTEKSVYATTTVKHRPTAIMGIAKVTNINSYDCFPLI